jgi:hypothetical protein
MEIMRIEPGISLDGAVARQGHDAWNSTAAILLSRLSLQAKPLRESTQNFLKAISEAAHSSAVAEAK